MEYLSDDLLTGFSETKRERGRPEEISTNSLHSRRDALIQAFENAWCVIGWELECAKSISDVRDAFRSFANLSYCRLEFLATESVLETDSKKLRATRKAQIHSVELLRAALERMDASEATSQKARAAFEQLKGSLQEKDLELACKVRERHLAANRRFYDQAVREEYELRRRIQAQEAHFAQTEILRFIEKRRYALNPRKLADAAAGLPYIGYRQSCKRCRLPKSAMPVAAAFQQFSFIRKLIESDSTNGPNFVDKVHQAVLKHKAKGYAMRELSENWYFLKQAIQAGMSGHHHPKSLPFRILAEYQRRIQNRSAADIFFQENEEV